jgi:hypothetical protein
MFETLVKPQHARSMALDRHTPEYLQDATRFQTHAHIFNGLWVIQTLRRYEGEPHYLLDPVYLAVEQTKPGSQFGRKRNGGRFELAYLAFVFSRHPDVRPWWQQAGHSIWTAAGFTERPSYSLCHRRFAELEHPDVIEAMELVARRLIQLAVKGSDGRVGRYLHFDSTEAETHARLQHACPEWAACRKAKTPGVWKRAALITATASTPMVRAERHLEAAAPEPAGAEEDTEIGEAEEIRRDPDKLRVKVGGCWYDVLDPTAGIRAYITNGRVKRFWVGFYNAKAIDHFTGAPVAVRITSASTNEFVTYPDLFRAAYENTDRLPIAVVADRGYSVSAVFEHNTRIGVASVMPWRGSGTVTDRAQEDRELHDRHGILRCKHCGAPTKLVSFAKSAGAKRGKELRGPRLYAKCLLPITAGCAARQSVGCDRAWRMLLPLWRDSPVYLALRHSHDRYERVHHHWRVRWRSGADDHSLRPKRRGRDNQQLRANAALLIEWLMICWRENWMPDSRPFGKPHPDRIIQEDGTQHSDSLRELRASLSLDQPYGAQAQKLKLGPARPVPITPAAARAEDPTEPAEPLVPGTDLLDQQQLDADERLPGDAAEVPLDDLPF